MRIGIDIRPFLREETGVGILFKKLLFSLARIDEKNEYFLFSSSFKDRFISEKIPPFKRGRFLDCRIPVKAVNFSWYRMSWPRLDFFFRTRLDLTHSPTPLILPTRGKKIVTIFDLFFLEHPRLSNREARKSFTARIGRSLERADGVMTISKESQNQILRYFPLVEKKLKVIYPGIDHAFWTETIPSETENLSSVSNLPSAFLLFVGATEARKNLVNLLQAFSLVREEYRDLFLVAAGPKGEDHERILDKIRELKLEDFVEILNYVDERKLKYLYSRAELFVFPSWHEGFGIPLLEAMACGVPIAASKGGALPEIGGEAALYFDPNSPEDMAEKIKTLLEDRTLRMQLIQTGKIRMLGFSWEKAASETLEFYQIVNGSL
ncbi:MAG: glycosyltransferase family 4 protein [Candidatus Aminicenantes bacterium]|nr:glycosyltransferase family 4 protein [Candidatus Aminicenantes bacterium]